MVADAAEGGAVQESLQDPVATTRPALVAPRAGCPQDRGELPAAAANESAEANREEWPTSARNSAVKTTPMPGKLLRISASGFVARAAPLDDGRAQRSSPWS
jgi:hypothetical protein